MLARRITTSTLAMALVACGAARAPAPPPPAPAPSASVVAAPAPKPPEPPKPSDDGRCPPVPAGATSDDDNPVISGGAAPAEVLAWLEARGVEAPAASSWYAKRYKVDATLAEALLGNARCESLTVGDPAEEALACHHFVSFGVTQGHAVILVVRKKKIVAVLDVGIDMASLDEGDHVLDLALRIDPDGKRVELKDRAADGTTVVVGQKECKRLVSEGVDPSTLRSGLGDGPPVLHDCAGARAKARANHAEIVAAGPEAVRGERETTTFLERACADRGRYVWKTDKFVRAK